MCRARSYLNYEFLACKSNRVEHVCVDEEVTTPHGFKRKFWQEVSGSSARAALWV